MSTTICSKLASVSFPSAVVSGSPPLESTTRSRLGVRRRCALPPGVLESASSSKEMLLFARGDRLDEHGEKGNIEKMHLM
jgi:hypothetical protein